MLNFLKSLKRFLGVLRHPLTIEGKSLKDFINTVKICGGETVLIEQFIEKDNHTLPNGAIDHISEILRYCLRLTSLLKGGMTVVYKDHKFSVIKRKFPPDFSPDNEAEATLHKERLKKDDNDNSFALNYRGEEMVNYLKAELGDDVIITLGKAV